MNSQQARQVLATYRPSIDPPDQEIQAAMQLMETDSQLRDWWHRQQAFHHSMRAKLARIPVPAYLPESLRMERKVVRPPFWTTHAKWWAAAAAVLVLAGFLVVVNNRSDVPDRFSNYQQRMVSTALRQYRMDIVTNDMAQVRGFLSASGAPADYEIPEGLQKLQLTGAGLLRWRSNPVGMVCFNRGDDQMLYLFVVDQEAVKDPPSGQPMRRDLHELTTLSWTSNGKVYVLAGPAEPGFVEKYL